MNQGRCASSIKISLLLTDQQSSLKLKPANCFRWTEILKSKKSFRKSPNTSCFKWIYEVINWFNWALSFKELDLRIFCNIFHAFGAVGFI